MVTSQNILECLLRAVRVEIDVAENTIHKIMEVTQVGHGYSFHIFFFGGCDQITPTQKNNIIGAMPRETGWQSGVRLSIRHVLPTHLVKISNVRTLIIVLIITKLLGGDCHLNQSYIQFPGHSCIHAQKTGWQLGVRSCIMPGLRRIQCRN